MYVRSLLSKGFRPSTYLVGRQAVAWDFLVTVTLGETKKRLCLPYPSGIVAHVDVGLCWLLVIELFRNSGGANAPEIDPTIE